MVFGRKKLDGIQYVSLSAEEASLKIIAKIDKEIESSQKAKKKAVMIKVNFGSENAPRLVREHYKKEGRKTKEVCDLSSRNLVVRCN